MARVTIGAGKIDRRPGAQNVRATGIASNGQRTTSNKINVRNLLGEARGERSADLQRRQQNALREGGAASTAGPGPVAPTNPGGKRPTPVTSTRTSKFANVGSALAAASQTRIPAAATPFVSGG